MSKPKASSLPWLAPPPGYPLQREAPNAGGTMERGAAAAVPWLVRSRGLVDAVYAAKKKRGMGKMGEGGGHAWNVGLKQSFIALQTNQKKTKEVVASKP